jgi:hypothetical protein
MSTIPLQSDVAAAYRERIRALQAAVEVQQERSSRISTLRLLSFLGAFAALTVRGFVGAAWGTFALILFAVLALLFFGLVLYQRVVRERLRRLQAQVALNREGPLRLARDWEALPPVRRSDAPAGHGYAADLDVAGHGSLLHLLGTTATVPGRATLTAWLLSPASPEVVRDRQGAVAELASRADFRDDLAVEGRLMVEDRPEALRALLAWASEESWLLLRAGTLLAALLLPLPTLSLAAYDFLVPGVPAWWAFPLAAQLLLVRAHRRRIHADFRRVASGESGIRGYAPLLARIEREEPEAPLLQSLVTLLAAGEAPDPAHVQLARLVRLVDLAEARHSWLHPILDLLFHWDIHVHRALERWRVRWGADLTKWLDAMGEVDALCALATLLNDHPDWCLPHFHSTSILRGRALGHPLLPSGRCVRNDIEVGPPGTFLLVTGSNMSGKSTLLRAIGANVALAQAGGPVCASELHLPAVTLWTSMRVVDSLKDGVSQFMVELQRLRQVVEAAKAPDSERTPPLLYLLDEVLQGTNSSERRVVARTVLRHLVAEGTLGVVSTHDLTLADASDLRERARAVHFRETVGGPEEGAPPLTFDYRLRPGLVPATNAVRLMEMIGMELRGDPDGEG